MSRCGSAAADSGDDESDEGEGEAGESQVEGDDDEVLELSLDGPPGLATVP